MQDLVVFQPALADVEAEQAVLSVVLQDAGAIDRLGDLSPEDFAEPINGAMFAAMQDLRAQRLPINTINLRNKAGVSPMGREAIMAQINKLSFAGELPNVTDLSRGIIDLSLRRQLQEAHRRYGISASDGSQTVPAQLAALRLEIDTIVSRLTRQGKVRLTHKEATDKMLEELQKDLADVLVPCGIRTIDRALAGGFRRGDYSILAGRPGAGKSTCALAIALGVAKQGSGVLYFTPEMSVEQLALRAASAAASTRMSPIPYERIMSKDWRSQTEEEQFYRVATSMPLLPIYYDGSTNLLASEMQARVKQAALDMEEAGFKLDMVIVDHMGKIRPTNRYKGNRVQEVGEISEAMAAIAKEENVAMLALHQLNRQVESRDNKRPGLSDLRDSGHLEQDADVVMMAFREAYYLEQKPENEGSEAEMERLDRLRTVANDLDILTSKNRRGRTGVMKLYCDVSCNLVLDL